MKIKEVGLITKQEVLDQLKRYGVEISSRTLAYYIAEKLIEPPIRKGMPGITGSVSFFREQTPLIIPGIKELTEKYELTLKEVRKYKDLIYNIKELEISSYFFELSGEIKNKYGIETDEFQYMKTIHDLNRIKFISVLKVYACAEAGYKYDPKISGLKIDNKDFIAIAFPTFKLLIDRNIVKTIHVKIVEKDILKSKNVVKTFEELKAFKEIIYSKEGMKII